MRRALSAFGVVCGLALIALVAPSAAASPHAVPVPPRQFTCSGIISDYYTLQTVTGIVKDVTPGRVNVLDWQNSVVSRARRPQLDPGWWGGYWFQTYQMNQWFVGSGRDSAFHLMIPTAPLGTSFTALLVTEFNQGGNWQNWMDCTAT